MRTVQLSVMLFAVGCQTPASAPDLETESWDDVEELVAELTVVPPELPDGEEWVQSRVAYLSGSISLGEDGGQVGELCLPGVLRRSTQTDLAWPSLRDLKAKGWSQSPLEIAKDVRVMPLDPGPAARERVLSHVG
ncbi:MAG: hypothetical protein AAF658_20350, partial [Myxococcota bacterium]